MPPEPWVLRDTAVERPFAASDIPFVDDAKREAINKGYPAARKPKALAISSRGSYSYYVGQASEHEAIRRGLELCGHFAGIPCMIVAIDDVFVVPVPTAMKIVGLFRPALAAAIVPELRNDVAQRLANATTGWKATAVGANGRAGLGLRAASEQEAVNAALEDCGRQDRACRVIAIGPFSVEPK
jgi:adenylate cyclase